MEFKCTFDVETSNPVKFRETFRMSDVFGFELSAHVALRISVEEFDESRYGNCDQLMEMIKSQTQEILTNVLNNKMQGVVMRGAGPQKYFQAIVEEELALMGVTAHVELISFALTDEADRLYKEKFEEAKIVVLRNSSW